MISQSTITKTKNFFSKILQALDRNIKIFMILHTILLPLSFICFYVFSHVFADRYPLAQSIFSITTIFIIIFFTVVYLVQIVYLALYDFKTNLDLIMRIFSVCGLTGFVLIGYVFMDLKLIINFLSIFVVFVIGQIVFVKLYFIEKQKLQRNEK